MPTRDLKDTPERRARIARMRQLVDEAGGPLAFRLKTGQTKQIVHQWLEGHGWPRDEVRIKVADALGFEDYRLLDPPREMIDEATKNFPGIRSQSP